LKEMSNKAKATQNIVADSRYVILRLKVAF
jgi:hypothetical protein